MIQYIGQDRKVHYLGDDELMHFNHNHDKLGRFSTSNGAVRAANKIDRLQEKIGNRQAKINKLNTKIKSNRNQKRLAKAAKYDAKLLKATRKARRASMKKAAGKTLSERDQKRLMKVEKLKAKSAGKTYKNEKWEAKVANLNYKNLKNQKKIDKLTAKYGTKTLSEIQRSQRMEKGRKYIEQDRANNDKQLRELSKKYDDANKKAFEAELAFYRKVDSDDYADIDTAYSEYTKAQQKLYEAEEKRNKRRKELRR